MVELGKNASERKQLIVEDREKLLSQTFFHSWCLLHMLSEHGKPHWQTNATTAYWLNEDIYLSSVYSQNH